MTVYETQNGVKPRYDGKGTEFGMMHRDLGPGYLMFDIDAMTARLSMDITMRRENEGFVEYRRRRNGIEFIAMFEVKASRTTRALEALDPNAANSMARLEMARKLNCRLFVVFGTNGVQPFTFYEVNTTTGDAEEVGTLDYNGDRTKAAIDFWRDVLQIQDINNGRL